MGDRTTDSLYHKCGEEAVLLLINEMKKHPILYRSSPRRISQPSVELKMAQKDAWLDVMKVMAETYGNNICEEVAWTTWRVLYVHYGTTNASKKWRDELSFLKGCKRPMVKRPAVKVVKRRQAMTTDHSEEVVPHKLPKSGANMESPPYHPSQKDTLYIRYGADACTQLINEVGKYPVIYNQILMHYKYSHQLPEEALLAWNKVMKAMDAKYAGVPTELAYRAWRTIQINYKKVNCPKKYAGKILFLNNVPRRKRSLKKSNWSDANLLLSISSGHRQETPIYPDIDFSSQESPNEILKKVVENTTNLQQDDMSELEINGSDFSTSEVYDDVPLNLSATSDRCEDDLEKSARPSAAQLELQPPLDPFKKLLEKIWRGAAESRAREAIMNIMWAKAVRTANV
ncbi:hypothetical protein QR680_019338 [Steinernema hermaphroditum]|uniref:MADF domain-containing protein n=1 Tax=Steinernema hermaphroditum TaxID=289476 RepID=A0AA39LAB6_9BILA|nr:hypothetical protein QR680_019338 [Steinernema hermaphroditum]